MTRQSARRDLEVRSTREAKPLFEQVGEWLDENDWTADAHADGGWYALAFRGDCADWRVIVDTAESATTRRVLIYSIFPFRVPAARRAAVAEFMARSNYELSLGNFELDAKDGECRFRTSADVVDGEMTGAIIKRLLDVNLYVSEHTLPTLLGVAFGTAEVAGERVGHPDGNKAASAALADLPVEGSVQ